MNILPSELFDSIWEYDGRYKRRYNECVKQLDTIFYTFNELMISTKHFHTDMWFKNKYNGRPDKYVLTKVKEERYERTLRYFLLRKVLY